MGRRLGCRRCEEKRRELDFFSLERGRLQWDLIAVSHLLSKGKGFLEKAEPGFPQRCTGGGQGVMGTSCGKGKTPCCKSGAALGQQLERWWDLHPWIFDNELCKALGNLIQLWG